MKYYLPAIICSIVIFILSTRATVSLPFFWTDILAADKIGHVVAYGGLTLTVLWGLSKDEIPFSSKWFLWTVIACSAYGILLEIIQYSFFPNRYFEVLDILANIIGSIIGLYVFKKIFHT